MRYAGQGWEIPVALPDAPFDDGSAALLKQRFETAYRTLFGRIIEGPEIEITNWSLNISTHLPPVSAIERHMHGEAVIPTKTREFFDAALRETVIAREIERSELSAGKMIQGPAVIVEDETTTIVTSSFTAIGQGDGSLLLVRKEANA